MPFEQILTLTIAGYGAVVSTVLVAREIKRDKRRILIILEYVAFYERAQLTITNVGQRPTTITEIGMWSYSKQNGRSMLERVPRNALFASDVYEEEPLPVSIKDGEHITLPLSEALSDILLSNGMKAQITVYDIEGKEYKKFRTRLHNPKWGYYDNKS